MAAEYPLITLSILGVAAIAYGGFFGSKDSKGERECRKALESLFGKPFPKSHPEWLKNPGTNKPLELDCYNEKLKLAVEYNGEQHYKVDGFFTKTKNDLVKQQKRDCAKAAACRKQGVTLIVVKYTVKPENIKNHILTELKKSGINPPRR